MLIKKTTSNSWFRGLESSFPSLRYWEVPAQDGKREAENSMLSKPYYVKLYYVLASEELKYYFKFVLWGTRPLSTKNPCFLLLEQVPKETNL